MFLFDRGGGPAGLTAAIYGVRSGISLEVIERGVAGRADLYRAPDRELSGFPGRDQRAGACGANEESGGKARSQIRPGPDAGRGVEGELKKLTLESGAVLTCDALILATGSRPSKLGVPGEVKLWGKGVSYCATCDGNFFRGQRWRWWAAATARARRPRCFRTWPRRSLSSTGASSSGRSNYIVQCALTEPNITVLWTRCWKRSRAFKRRGITVKNTKTGRDLPDAHGRVFIYVGVKPITDCLQGVIELTPEGFIKAGEDTKTSVPGIFAAGDVRQKRRPADRHRGRRRRFRDPGGGKLLHRAGIFGEVCLAALTAGARRLGRVPGGGPLQVWRSSRIFCPTWARAARSFSEDPRAPFRSMVTAFLSASMAESSIVERIKARARRSRRTSREWSGLQVTAVADQDWGEGWKKTLQPERLDPGIWIVPSFLPVPAEAKDEPMIRLDPGLAFGTGGHVTTRTASNWSPRRSAPGPARCSTRHRHRRPGHGPRRSAGRARPGPGH